MKINRDEFRNHFEVLELPLDSSLQEIRTSYNYLKELYSTDSIVTLPAAGEISNESVAEILESIEDAYQHLLLLFKEEGKALDYELKRLVDEISEFDGHALRQIRIALHVDLEDVADTTKVQLRHLKNIEEEDFAALPVPVYTRGFVVLLAKYLSLDPEKVAQDYMKRFADWKKENP
ncbi:MAG: helix-turn-helix domain-containing protein [Proteobacteria bacterium]|nr:helix-turn-helix domain-containing protein [Pseudomonadota bacterium]MBU1710293.1 helix-turn-helix domain-containing protein [Pseudomonadota bacterium]